MTRSDVAGQGRVRRRSPMFAGCCRSPDTPSETSIEQPRGQGWPKGAFLRLRTVSSCRSDSRISFQFALPWRRRSSRSRKRLDWRSTPDFRGRLRMHIIQSRRDFLTTLSAAGAAGVLGARKSLADEGPPETTTVRLRHDPRICVAPWYVGEELLRAEGFTESAMCRVQAGLSERDVARGELDFASIIAARGLSAGCRRAGHGVGGCACRVLRAVRARANPHHQRPEGQEGRHPRRSARATPVFGDHGRQCRARPAQGHRWVRQSDRQSHGAVRRR